MYTKSTNKETAIEDLESWSCESGYYLRWQRHKPSVWKSLKEFWLGGLVIISRLYKGKSAQHTTLMYQKVCLNEACSNKETIGSACNSLHPKILGGI